MKAFILTIALLASSFVASAQIAWREATAAEAAAGTAGAPAVMTPRRVAGAGGGGGPTNGATASQVTNIVNALAYSFPTNLFTGTSFVLTNSTIVSATNIYLTGVANAPTGAIGGYGEMTIIAAGSITVTNTAAIHTSDGLTTRSLTTGQSLEIALKVLPNLRTNAALTLIP
jgi:hypothetical protein